MKALFALLYLLLLATFVSGQSRTPARPKQLALIHVTVIDGTGAKPRRDMTVVITGVRDMGSPLEDILRLRQETNEGKIRGPRMVIAGPLLQGPLPFQTPFIM